MILSHSFDNNTGGGAGVGAGMSSAGSMGGGPGGAYQLSNYSKSNMSGVQLFNNNSLHGIPMNSNTYDYYNTG